VPQSSARPTLALGESPPGPPVPPDVLRLVEAFVFASAQPVPAAALRPLIPEPLDPAAVLDALRRSCSGRGVVLVEAAGGWVFRTAPDLADALGAALAEPRRLSRTGMEVLAVVALHQPVTRAEIEAVRGAALGQATMDALLDAGLIQPAGRKEAPGRPTLWATTPVFLERFGLRSLRDLPDLQEAGLPDPGATAANNGDTP